ncbi:MAG: 30S ribosomal protein S20 [Planctomycetia bacterium]|nr:MAG: 30S ribosomal protein S20 [Planctomycetia bacterium]
MAHSLSAEKRIRQNAKRNARNRARKAELKSVMRKTQAALAGSDVAAAETAVKAAIRKLDRDSTGPTLHRNAAARRKSKLARKLNALKAGKK